ncbi:MAG: heme exporter protein CcmB [Bacteroidota bacterium]
MANRINLLFYKDFLLELRTKSALGGIIIYLISTVFVCYLAFDGFISLKVWNALFWIVLLFSSFNAILKAFMNENSERNFYYYSIVDPNSYINAKIIYNTILMIVLSFFALGIFIVFMGNVVQNILGFIVVMIFGVLGIASVLTLMSAIASKARNNFTLLAILSFPIVLPQLLVLLKASEKTIEGDSLAMVFPEIIISLLISAIAVVLSNLLFQYIWQE